MRGNLSFIRIDDLEDRLLCCRARIAFGGDVTLAGILEVSAAESTSSAAFGEVRVPFMTLAETAHAAV